MAHYRIGLDPGVSGAYAILDGELRLVEWGLTPVLKQGSSTRVNAAALADMLADFDAAHAYVELVAARPGQGVSSCFSFGHSAGVIAGVLGALSIKTTMVTPQAWKKRAGLIGLDKDAARSRAIQLWPEWRALDRKGAGQALADAALIARFGEAS